MAELLQKDAIYCALGLCATDLYDFLDFDQWFKGILIKEVNDKAAQ